MQLVLFSVECAMCRLNEKGGMDFGAQRMKSEMRLHFYIVHEVTLPQVFAFS